MSGVTELPWPCSGMNGTANGCAPGIAWPSAPVIVTFQVLVPRAGGVGSPETSVTVTLPLGEVRARPFDHASTPARFRQLSLGPASGTGGAPPHCTAAAR